jgi:membrane-associated phospholipid phosphatase
MGFHPGPLALDLATTREVQSLPIPAWLNALLNFPSVLNDPLPSIVALILWIVFLVLGGFRARSRGGSALPWWFTALFFALAIQASAGLNVILDELVKRKRPLPGDGIRVVGPIVPFPTYPSGHTEHDVVYYGYLLYLSLTWRVRHWRYSWLLLPLQIYAVFDLLTIGFSRIELGDHWLTDVLGGYLEGALSLCFFIFLYHLVDRIRAQKLAPHTGSAPSSPRGQPSRPAQPDSADMTETPTRQKHK